MKELITFEMIMHFDPELKGSVNDLIDDIKYAVMSQYGKGLIDIELICTKTERTNK